MNRIMPKFKKTIQIVTFAALSIFAFSCKTTKEIQLYDDYKQKTSFEAPDPENYKATDDDAYIFIRLYNPVYPNPLEVTNLLKFGLYATNTSEKVVSHAAINFDLDDDFYGLTVGGKQQLKIENCTNPKSNKFMKKCSKKSSVQYTYALKVPRSEYEASKAMVEDFFNNYNLKYSVGWNFPSACYSVHRKFFTTKKNRNFGNPKLTKKSYNIVNDINPRKVPTKYVCSSFIAYILLQNVTQATDLFIEKNINYRYVSPGDYEEFPNIILLFYSTWADYNKAAKMFVEENPDFAEYFHAADFEN